jgi:hypothetical protein
MFKEVTDLTILYLIMHIASNFEIIWKKAVMA